MIKQMSLTARKELILSVWQKYHDANWSSKGKILDGFVAATGYDRKYSIQLLNATKKPSVTQKRSLPKKNDAQLRQALIFVWNTANQICSKRLVPFMPQLVTAMEQHGHLRLQPDVRKRLLSISSATVDRMLRSERERNKCGVSTTRAGNLLKNQIQIRTFADWDNVVPGFIEADLVAHCGGNTNGSFINTLTLVDITTGWLECMPLLRKSAKDVIDGLKIAGELMPFPLLGLDTDCGSEFINYDLLDYCEENRITFTRARTHKKNDQAHVEEKNGSVVRRIVGYDRFQGTKAWKALALLYRVLRKYVNFFQPSLKLLKKERLGAKITKQYDRAKTPYQRILLSEKISTRTKQSLRAEYETLDPVYLLKEIEKLQDELWKYSWNENGSAALSDLTVTSEDVVATTSQKSAETNKASRYYKQCKKIDLRKMPRTWRTRKDPLKEVWDEIRLRLELRPETNACEILDWLIIKHPEKYSKSHTRTLQRRIANWRKEQESQEDKLRLLMMSDKLSEIGHTSTNVDFGSISDIH